MIWKKIRQTYQLIFISFEMEMKQNLTDAFILFGIIVQPMIIAFLALWMLKGRGSDYAIFVAVGSGMTGLWTTLLFSSGNSITGERWTGTLENLVGSPVPMRLVVFGKNLADVVQSLLSVLVCYTLISLILGYALNVAQPLFFIISLLLTVFSFVCFGLVMSTLFILNPDIGRFQNGLEFPVYILGGFLFPIAVLPIWSTPLSYLLTPYWAAIALHGTTSGNLPINQVLFSWLMMILFSVFYLVISESLFKKVLYKAREDATLSMQ
jgi:ABC-2 type transport system permease protein